MKLTKLYKDPGSGNGGCLTVYLAENGEFVFQAHELDADTQDQVENVLPGETFGRMPAEIVLKAVEQYKRMQGH